VASGEQELAGIENAFSGTGQVVIPESSASVRPCAFTRTAGFPGRSHGIDFDRQGLQFLLQWQRAAGTCQDQHRLDAGSLDHSGQQFRACHTAHHPRTIHQQHAISDRRCQSANCRNQWQPETAGIQCAERLDDFHGPGSAFPATETHGAGHTEQG